MNSASVHFALHATKVATVWLALLVAVFVPLEWLFALHPTKFWRKQMGVDLAWYFVNSLIPAAILSFPLLFMSRLLHGADPGGFYSMVAGWPLWVRIVASLFVADFGAYWGHRAFHAFPFLWRFHAVHHSAEHMDWLVNSRSHPIDMVLTKLSGLIPLYFLGLAQVSPTHPDDMVALVAIVGTMWTYFVHANVRFRLGPLEWVISTPAFHHWHHTNDEHRDRNFAAMFPWIDRIFGTSWLPNYWPPVYGIDAKIPDSVMSQLLHPVMPEEAANSGTSAKAQVANGKESSATVASPSPMAATQAGEKTEA
jgi:sterol desaturase/sphingolipid hydroxylase (fatty acid hydroxylase superfamily)